MLTVSMGRFPWIYDPAGRLVDLKYTKPDGTVISDFAYTHDAAGNILSKTTDFGLIQYGYDALDRLVLADYDWKADETFAYDAVGNRTADAEHPVWHYDAANQLLAYGAGPHDPAGQTPPTVPAFTFAYDANGSTVSKTDPAAGTADQYGYSFDNRMREVWRNGELVARYFYDHLSQRIRKDLFTDGSPTGTTWYVCGLEGVLSEYDNSGALIKKYAYHLDHPWGTQPLWQMDAPGSFNYYISNHIGTPQSMVNDSIVRTWHTDWNVFNPEIIEQEVEAVLRFPGQYWDSESGLNYNNYRYFDKETGRYMQQDPLEILGITLEPKYHYTYSKSNPVRYFDPYGLVSWCGGSPDDLVPDYFDLTGPQSWAWPGLLGGAVSFKEPCMTHDFCYGCTGKRRGKTKNTCDYEFYLDMYSQCSKMSIIYRLNCYSLAYIYYNAVLEWGGPFFDEARKCCD